MNDEEFFKQLKKAPRPKRNREADHESSFRQWCKANGLLTYKWTSPSCAGVPDRIVIGPGGVLFLELKAKGKKPTDLQLQVMSDILAAGGNANWSDNLERSKELCSGLLKNTSAKS